MGSFFIWSARKDLAFLSLFVDDRLVVAFFAFVHEDVGFLHVLDDL